MTVRQFLARLRHLVQIAIDHDDPEIREVKVNYYSGGGSLHIVCADGRKFRVLVEEE